MNKEFGRIRGHHQPFHGFRHSFPVFTGPENLDGPIGLGKSFKPFKTPQTVLGGIISILIGVWGIGAWWWSFLELLKGSVPPILVLGGLAALFAGISEIKDSIEAKKEGEKKKEEKK